jgi:adenylosuccinate synthase
VSYNGIRLADLMDREVLAGKLRVQLAVKNRILTAFDMQPLDPRKLEDELIGQYERLREVIREPFGMLQEALSNSKHILLEGAQGALLDNNWGTYPFCTASETLAGGACAGLGIAPRYITRVVGVAKAYTSRVGAGPFPTELLDESGELLREEGDEFGTVTGRPRRCGWFDAEAVKFACQLNGATELVLTKLDVLDKLSTIQVCTGYKRPGRMETSHYWQGDARWLQDCTPVYEDLPGWQSAIRLSRRYNDLPHLARSYVQRIEELVNVRISGISVGPNRSETIWV